VYCALRFVEDAVKFAQAQGDVQHLYATKCMLYRPKVGKVKSDIRPTSQVTPVVPQFFFILNQSLGMKKLTNPYAPYSYIGFILSTVQYR